MSARKGKQVNSRTIWRPDKGRPDGFQRRILEDMAHVFEVLSAGSVGSGKTEAALMGAVSLDVYRTHPKFKGVIIRRSDANKVTSGPAFQEFWQRITDPGMWGAYVGGWLNRSDGVYRFPSGGEVIFTSTRDLRSLQGLEVQYVMMDELTHWDKPDDYKYVALTRARSSDGLPIQIRPTTNPGGPGHRWVREYWGPWLAKDYLSRGMDGRYLYQGAESLAALGYEPRFCPSTGLPLPPLNSGEILNFIFKDGQTVYVPRETKGSLTRSCLRSKTSDNAALGESDPTYEMRVQGIGGAKAQQLGLDEWDIAEGFNDFFNRDWFEIIPEAPPITGLVRRWDLAWTKRKQSDWTVGVLLGWDDKGRWYILNIVRMRGNPDEVFSAIKQTADIDLAAYGRGVTVVVPQDYSAGIVVVDTVTRLLPGHIVKSVRETGKKELRIATIQPQAQAGRFKLIAGAWNHELLAEASAYSFEKTCVDDQLDALAGAYIWAIDERKPPSVNQAKQDVKGFAQLGRDLSQWLERPVTV